MSSVELAEVIKQLDEYLSKGWIRPSTSPYGAPIIFTRLKDQTLRMCIDYWPCTSKQGLISSHYPRSMICWTSWLMLTVLVALTSTLVTIKLQSTQGMSTKQLSYPSMVSLSLLYCHLA